MKFHNIIIALTLCIGLHVNAAQKQMTKEQEIQHQVNMILEWAKTEKEMNGEKSLNQKKDTVQFLNPRPGDSEIKLEAKKRAKAKLFPTKQPLIRTTQPKKGYWESYAPQFMQDTLESTKNYLASWVPQSIKDRVNGWSTSTKFTVIAAILASLLTIYNKEELINWLNNFFGEGEHFTRLRKSGQSMTVQQFKKKLGQ